MRNLCGKSEDLHQIQAAVIRFPDLIGDVHVNLFGDGAVSMSELPADGLDRDTGLRHETGIGMAETVNRQGRAVDLRYMLSEILAVCFVVYRASVSPWKEQSRPDTVSKADLLLAEQDGLYQGE